MDRMFAGIVHRFKEYGIDVRKEPILVFPTQHYQNGGIEIDPQGKTSIPGLFAAGECSGGVQGRNRLGGNSLLVIFVFGRRSGNSAVEYFKNIEIGPLTLKHIKEYHIQLELAGINNDCLSPMLLPDYIREEVKKKRSEG